MTPEELEKWLEARPEETRQQEAVWIAHRCAMRVLPVGLNIAHKVGLEVSTMLRANLVLSVASLRPSDELTTAVVAATRAAEAYIGASNESYSRLSSDGWRSDPLDRPAAATHASMRASLRDGGVTAAASALAAAATAFQPVEDEVSEDVQSLEAEYDLDSLQLWSVSDAPEKILVTWAFGEKNPWDFWINWYLRALEGTPQPMDLLEKIALQPDEFWDGTDGEVNTRIAEIVAEWDAAQGDAAPDAAAKVQRLPPATVEQVQRTKTAMETYREDLPPTFDAVLGFVELEIQRLQGKNYFPDPDEDAREENRRQIKVLRTLHQAVSRLKELVPDTAEMPREDAEEAEKLGRLYVRLFKEWPRANAEELVDNAYRGSLIGMTTLALPMIGVAPTAALAGGMIIFGGKKMIDAAKSAKDLLK